MGTITIEQLITAIISLLGGLAVLLVGFKLLSDNIEKLANTGLKRMFSKTSKNVLVGVGIGALATAVIQSSGATTVMVVGFVNAGIMNLFQATAMIMGANIGTTITAQIAALGSFDFAKYATLLGVIGIFMYMLLKKDKLKTMGLALSGLGLVFIALDLMSSSMDVFKQMPIVTDFLKSCGNPLVLLLFGIIFTTLLQSSSATTTIIISMVAKGLMVGNDANDILFVILGSNIGSCTTALLSSIGASSNAKRASLIHLLFNTFGSVLFFVLLLVWPSFMEVTFMNWFKDAPSTQIAMFHTFFNLICTCLFLPFTSVFVKTAELLIKDKKKEVVTSFIDDRFLKTPAVALAQASKETLRLGRLSMDTLSLAIQAFKNKNEDAEIQIKENVKNLEELNQALLTYLVKVASTQLSDEDENYVSKLHSILNDFYREVEIADNMMKYTKSVVAQDLKFSNHVYDQIEQFNEKLTLQYENIVKLFDENNRAILYVIDDLEEEIDDMRSKMIKQHIDRLENNECSPASSGVFINLVSNLERAGDHLNYIAHTIVE